MPATRGTAVRSTGLPTWVRSDLERVLHSFTSYSLQALIWCYSFKDSSGFIHMHIGEYCT